MEQCILTGGTILLSVSAVYLISIYDSALLYQWGRLDSELDGIPPIDEYIRDCIGNSQPSLRDRISATSKSKISSLYGKLRVTIPIDKKSSRITRPKQIT